jgi:apolipoprotein N-acyltransferase
MGWLCVAGAALEAALLFRGPWAVPWDRLVLSDYAYLAILAMHLVSGILLLAVARGPARRFGLRLVLPEPLFLVTLVFFLFSYIYALNANMDYAQRFFAGGGKVRLALDTRAERLAAAVRYLPLLAVDLCAYLLARLRRYPPWRASGDRAARWALPLTLVSVALTCLSFPSFAVLDGLGFLCLIALVPLFVVLEGSSLLRGWLYTVAYGVLSGMLVSFWLGTFSLVTLQLVTLCLMLAHALYFLPALWLVRRLTKLRFLGLALAWVLFEYLRSIGYWGYPWGLWGTAPYLFLTLTQVAELAGVWAVSLVVLLFNAGLAAVLRAPDRGKGLRRGGPAALWAFGLLLACLAFGLVRREQIEAEPVTKTVRLVLVQQNSDPRKDDYGATLATLRRLTDQAMLERPELVVWSETAFVPNIRRWSGEDPEREPLARLVREFLDYQAGLRMWLLTGNDDYELRRGEGGEEVRLDYNAAVLFDPQGRRVATYHKLHLVPFTEYFPFEKELPGLYKWLLSFDVYLWEPGRKRVIFRHPRLAFFTPICFEDSFPGDIRRFVLEGGEAIVNISNDYWSLHEAEAKQHAVNASFRAVENRRPLLRATASGLTCYVDIDGSFRDSTPMYAENFLLADVLFRPEQTTPYTRWGDWLPQAAAAALALLALLSAFPGARKRL